MARLSFLITLIIFLSCNSEKETTDEESTEFNYQAFSEDFKTASLPYQLSDTSLQNNKDTSRVKGTAFSSMIPDSIMSKIFGKGARVKFTPMVKIEVPKAERYFIVKGVSKSKKAALLFTFSDKDELSAVFPFLVPDNEASTFQTSSIDKAYSISRNVIRRKTDDINAEGKDVFVYNKDAHGFTLIMTDPLDEKNLELLNPIDTLSKQHKFAGDYTKDKRNFVSIRDGRKPNSLTVFVHIEKDGDCSGEIKGDAEITSPTTAVYRQPGDPCILQLTFTSSSVKLSEVEGCGSRRGLTCAFDGSFSKKKQPKAKSKKA